MNEAGQSSGKTVLVLGANSDVAKEAIKLFIKKGHFIIAASRNVNELNQFANKQSFGPNQLMIMYFDSTAFDTHQSFYNSLPSKPAIVLYAAGYLKDNEYALQNWHGTQQMMLVNYSGAVSILNIIATDTSNAGLRRIIGISSLSGVRGRKSNFVYGSTKAAFTQYLAGLRQHLAARNIIVNVIVSGYIRTKINAGLELQESLMLEPAFVAEAIVNPVKKFLIVPGFKWKIIYLVLKLLPESLVAKLP